MKRYNILIALLLLAFISKAQKIIEVNGQVAVDCRQLPEGCVRTEAEVSASVDPNSGITIRHAHRNNYGRTNTVLNDKVSPLFLVSMVNVKADGGIANNEMCNWALASGWDVSANTNIKGNLVASAPTGCRAYRGKDGQDPIGSWRLPTIREWHLIWILKPQLEKFSGFTKFWNGVFWSSTEYMKTGASHISLQDGNSYSNYDKKSFMRVRCIKDIKD